MNVPRRSSVMTAVTLVVAAVVVVAVVVIATARGGSRPRARPVIRSAAARVRAGHAPAQAVHVTARHPRSRAAGGHYGGLPSWLPKATIPVNRVVTATPAHPALGIEGDTITVRLAGARAVVTTVGPVVPEEGRFPVPATSPCTFTISFARSHGVIHLAAGQFTVLDELGHIHHLRVRLSDGRPLPARVPAGRILTITASTVLPTGNGRLRWTPGTAKPLAAWDFDVEID